MKAARPTLRVGIVGAGDNTRTRHIPQLRAIDGVALVGVANRRRASAERVARDCGIPHVFDRWEDLVAARDLDAVVIGTWPNLHAPVTVAALDAGKHVLCEARMAMDLAGARQMVAAARRHPELVAQVVPAPFTLHVDRTIQRRLCEGYIGTLLAAELHIKSGAFTDPEAPLHWRQDVACSGVNIMSLGIWYEALMRWIGEARSVFARGTVSIAERRDAETGVRVPVRIPDYLTVSATMAGGVPATFLIATVTGGVRANEVLLFGTAGTLRFADGVLYGQRRGEPAMREIELPAHEAIGWRVEREFVDAIRGVGVIERTTFADGLRYMAFTAAVADSIAANRSVAVPA